jgi:hypothetical protein
MGEQGFVSVGVAAHIRAASEGGARYDALQTPQERKSFDNGIWLCQNHAHHVDHDAQKFPVDTLREWKRNAEQRAFDQLIGTGGEARVYAPSDELIEELRTVVAELRLPQTDDLDAIRLKVMSRARLHLDTFHRAPGWPRHAVQLAMTVEGEVSTTTRFDASRLGQLLQVAQEIALVAPPGMGKTTTLLQAGQALSDGSTVPVFIPLKEWAEGSDDLFGWAVNRNSLAGIRTEYLKFLAYHGQLALLLDGWNEVSAGARRRLIVELEGLRRDFPLLGVLMSTRRQAIDVPLQSPYRIAILQMSEDQQKELAAGLAGEVGLNVLDRAWRTPSLRDLVGIPLYLSVLLKVSPDGQLPESGEEVLRRFINEHEGDAARAEVLQRRLFGNQQSYLTGLAVAAQEHGKAAITAVTAQQAIGKVNQDLVSTYIVQTPPNPAEVLDVLVGTHALERDPGGNVSFQHQQFQEWYASLNIERELRNSMPLTLKTPFVVERLNNPEWGESILFACERLSRNGRGGATFVAQVVEVLLRIDPIFAATLIRRSSLATWTLVSVTVLAFAKAWHKPGVPDRALAFMITTGRPEFSDVVWPLVTNVDHQIRLRSLRVAGRFYPSVLGERIDVDYARLREQIRSSLLGELVDRAHSAGIDVAMKFALTDDSIVVRQQVFESLNFRGAGRLAEELLRSSSPEVIAAIAARGYYDEISDPDLLAKLEGAQRAQWEAIEAPDLRLARMPRTISKAERAKATAELLSNPVFNFKSDAARDSIFEVARNFPQVLETALVARIEAGMELPRQVQEYLGDIAGRDTDLIRDMLKTPHEAAAKRAAFIAGPDSTHELCVQYLSSHDAWAQHGERSPAAYLPVRNLENVLSLTPDSSFFEAITRFGPDISPDDVSRLCWLIEAHGKESSRGAPNPSSELGAKIIQKLQQWADALLVSSSATRRHFADVAKAMRGVPHPTHAAYLDRMLDRDQNIYRRAHEAYQIDNRNESTLHEIRTLHEWAYRDALVAVGTDEAERVLREHLSDQHFGREAAVGLMLIWRNQTDLEGQAHLGRWPDANAAAVARQFRDKNPATTTASAEAIFSTVTALLDHREPQDLLRAASMAGTAVLMPHGDKSVTLDRILAEALPPFGAYELLSRMVMGGIKVRSTDLMVGYSAAIDEVKDRKWFSEQDVRGLIRWIELFPFSNRPMDTLAALDVFPESIRLPPWYFRDLLEPIAVMAGAEAQMLIRELLRRFPELSDQYELSLALLKQPLTVLIDILVDIANGQIGSRRGLVAVGHHLPEQLAQRLSPVDRDLIVTRFQEAPHGSGKAFLGEIVAAANDPDLFLLLAQDQTGRAVLKNRLHWTLRELVHDKVSLDDSLTHYEVFRRDSSRLRAGLFSLTLVDDPALSSFATRCLDIVDATRDEEGALGTEPRHPDISTGAPWPKVTGGSGAWREQ